MNEVTNQSLQANVSRASSVSFKPKAEKAGQEGKSLPPVAAQKVEKAPVQDKSSVVPMAEKLDSAVIEVSQYAQNVQRDLQFSVDDSSGRTVVTVLDRETQEIIRQIPGEAFLKMAQKLKENMAAGQEDSLHLINARA